MGRPRALGQWESGLLFADGQGQLRLAVSSSESARLLELYQLQNHEGPCLDCYRTGGPVFEPDDAPPRAVLATVSGGNPLCNAVGRFYRTDTPTAHDFLRSQGIAVP